MSYYGDGADGNVSVVSQAITLSRNMWYDTLTVDAASSIDPAGYDINCKTLLDNSGLISRDGAAGAVGAGATNQDGGAGGSALAAAMVRGSTAGRNGRSGPT